MRLSLLLIFVLLSLFLGCSEPVPVEDLEARIAESQLQIAKLENALSSATNSNAQINTKLEQMASTLSQVTSQRNLLADELLQLKADRKLALARSDAPSKVPDGLEIPKQIEIDGPGNTKVTTYYLNELKSPIGQSLGKSLTFSQALGRKLIFRQQDGPPISVDVDAVHPFILAAMDISAERQKAEQTQLDERKRHQDLVGKENYARKVAADNMAVRANAEMELKRAVIQAEQSQQAARIALQAEAIRNDRMRAEAAMRQADAAMQAAQREPTPSTVILNQNSLNGRSQGFWFNGVYYPR